MSDALPPAGWFPDPEDPANLRYWDGAAWTADRHAADPAGAPAAPTAPQFAAPPAVAAPYGAAYTVPVQNVPALVGLLLAIVGTVLGVLIGVFLLVALAGAIVSIVGFARATRMRAAGAPNDRRGLALAGMIVGFGGLLLAIAVGVGAAVYYSTTSWTF